MSRTWILHANRRHVPSGATEAGYERRTGRGAHCRLIAWQVIGHTGTISAALVADTVVFVGFASTDNVALVFPVNPSLYGTAVEYGAATAAFGAGMAAASLALAAWADRRGRRALAHRRHQPRHHRHRRHRPGLH